MDISHELERAIHRMKRTAHNLESLSERREFFEREIAGTIIQIAEAEVARIDAIDEMKRVCV